MTDLPHPKLRFRPPGETLGPITAALDPMYDLIESIWLPVHFFVHPDLKLAWQFEPREEVPWEYYRGALLDAWQCRERRTMSGWNIFRLENGQRSAAPLISLKLDPEERTIHVLRGIEVYAWEPPATAEAPEVEVRRWQRELVGSCRLDHFRELEELRDELVCLLWQAVVGTSRLPLTSAQAPHPFFTFGMLHYIFREECTVGCAERERVRPMRELSQVVYQGSFRPMREEERAKLLEFSLRSGSEQDVSEVLKLWLARWDGVHPEPPRWMRRMFNDVSLSPYTGFVTRALDFWQSLAANRIISRQEEIAFFAFLLRQAYRHLNAYDLVLFHHRGANYPDALLVEEVLPRLAWAVETANAPRSWKLAVVLGCLLVQRYRDHAAPDEPTSPGENARVLPGTTQRVPPEQIEQPHVRTRRLFADWDWRARLGAAVVPTLQAVIESFEDNDFLQLGTALFIDRPFGEGKDILEPDQTPLLAHEAFSVTLANAQVSRLRALAEELGLELSEEQRRRLRAREPKEIAVAGIPIQQIADSKRPVPSLADARRVAPDFIVTRTMSGSLRLIREVFGPHLEDWQDIRIVARLARSERTTALAFLDSSYQIKRQYEVDASRGFCSRAGVEFPAAGLRELA